LILIKGRFLENRKEGKRRELKNETSRANISSTRDTSFSTLPLRASMGGKVESYDCLLFRRMKPEGGEHVSELRLSSSTGRGERQKMPQREEKRKRGEGRGKRRGGSSSSRMSLSLLGSNFQHQQLLPSQTFEPSTQAAPSSTSVGSRTKAHLPTSGESSHPTALVLEVSFSLLHAARLAFEPRNLTTTFPSLPPSCFTRVSVLFVRKVSGNFCSIDRLDPSSTKGDKGSI